MSTDALTESPKSLHYTVKAFLFSVPLKVQLWRRGGSLFRVLLSASFKYPPPLGPLKRYELQWTYDADQVLIEEDWSGKLTSARAAITAEKLDLMQLFWGQGSACLSGGEIPLLWRKDDVVCQHPQKQGERFSFELSRKGHRLVNADGRMGTDGVLKTLKLSLSLPIKLGAITIERTESVSS